MTQLHDLLHILPQELHHGEAFVIGTAPALAALRDAIDLALRDGAAACGASPIDGEGYWCVVLRATPEEMDAVPLPYATPDWHDYEATWPAWIGERAGVAVQALLAARKTQETKPESA